MRLPTFLKPPTDGSRVERPTPSLSFSASLPRQEQQVDPLSVIGKRNEDLRQGVEVLFERLEQIDQFRAQFQGLVGGVATVIEELEATKLRFAEVQGSLNAERDAHTDVRGRLAQTSADLDRLTQENQLLGNERSRLEGMVHQLESASEEMSLALREKEISINDLERQLRGEAERARQLNSENESRREEIDRLSGIVAALELDIGNLQDKTGLLEEENRTLAQALQDAQASTFRLNRQVSELEPLVQRLREQNAQLDHNLQSEREMRDRLNSQKIEESERARADVSALQVKLEAVSSRADANERFLGEARRQLRDKLEELRVSERKGIDAALQVNTLQKKIEANERDQAQAAAKIEELENSRKLIMERADMIAKAAKAKDVALQKTEQKIAFLSDRIEENAKRAQRDRDQLEARLAEMAEALEKERTERAIAEGALQSARRDRLQLQREVLSAKAAARPERSFESEPAPKNPDLVDLEDLDDNITRLNSAN
jgi:crescentin